jgi:hypothetical protein
VIRATSKWVVDDRVALRREQDHDGEQPADGELRDRLQEFRLVPGAALRRLTEVLMVLSSSRHGFRFAGYVSAIWELAE